MELNGTEWILISQQKEILQRPIPDILKLAIAQKIEDNLFSKVE